MVTHSPRSNALFGCVVDAEWLTFNTWFHQMVTANGTCVHHDIPRPECHGGPFFHLKPLFLFRLDLLQRLARLAVNVYAIIFIHLDVLVGTSEHVSNLGKCTAYNAYNTRNPGGGGFSHTVEELRLFGLVPLRNIGTNAYCQIFGLLFQGFELLSLGLL